MKYILIGLLLISAAPILAQDNIPLGTVCVVTFDPFVSHVWKMPARFSCDGAPTQAMEAVAGESAEDSLAVQSGQLAKFAKLGYRLVSCDTHHRCLLQRP